MEKVVKCNNNYCGQYFMHTEKAIKCPFCYTKYVEVYVEVKEKAKDKEETTKKPKESFKIFKK